MSNVEAGNQKVIDNLQTSCELFAHLAAQYNLDVHQLKMLGVKWLAHRAKCWHKGSGKFLGQFVDRLLYFDEAPSYEPGEITTAESVDALLERDLDLVNAAHEALTGFRKDAWNAEADYTPDVYEHAIGELEHQAKHIARERALIQKLTEPGYIAARLGDGSDSD
jgi:bacterioferritin (cytochrome b1)